jgi:DNA-directed RNA polymerase specialized sigma subunit
MEMTIEQRNEFIEKNAGIIGDIINKPFKKKSGNYKQLAERSGYEYDDVYNSGIIGMIEGIENYDIQKATKADGRVVPLEAFVRWDIKRKISEFIATPRKHDRIENKVSMQQQITSNEGSKESSTVGDMIEDSSIDTSQYCVKMDCNVIKEILESDLLTETEKIAIDARFNKNLVLREINEILVKHLNNPKAKAFYFLNTAMAKLRKALVA